MISARNGYLHLPGESPARAGAEGARRASASIFAKYRGRTRFVLGWEGDLQLRVNGRVVPTPKHDDYAVETLWSNLRAGENAIELTLQPSAGERVYVVALGKKGTPRLPRPGADAPHFWTGGSNAGQILGLDGVASLLPWLLGVAALLTMLIRSVCRAE